MLYVPVRAWDRVRQQVTGAGSLLAWMNSVQRSALCKKGCASVEAPHRMCRTNVLIPLWCECMCVCAAECEGDEMREEMRGKSNERKGRRR